jgi:Domain of unknown function (DUF4440)
MRPLFTTLCLTLAISTLSLAQSPAPATRDEEQLVWIEQDWLAAEASGDTAKLRPLFAEDFIATGPGGNLLTRDDLLPTQNSPENHLPKSTLEESAVRVFGATGILMGRVAVEDAQHPAKFLVVTVFQKRGPKWIVIAAQMARAPASEE